MSIRPDYSGVLGSMIRTFSQFFSINYEEETYIFENPDIAESVHDTAVEVANNEYVLSVGDFLFIYDGEISVDVLDDDGVIEIMNQAWRTVTDNQSESTEHFVEETMRKLEQ